MNLIAEPRFSHDTRRLQAKTRAFIQALSPGLAPGPQERGMRGLEEMVELVQALGVTQAQAQRVLDYVYSRPVGEIRQEIGGAAIGLGAIASLVGADVGECWEIEVDRVLGCIEQVRAKHKFKEGHGIVVQPTQDAVEVGP